MNIQLTENSRDKLASLSISENHGIRLIVDYKGGGCSCDLTVEMMIDQKHPDDLSGIDDNLLVVMDPSSYRLCGSDVLTLDYKSRMGFILRTPNETLAYGISLKRYH